MSMHKSDWLEMFNRVGAFIQTHPLPFAIGAAVVAAFIVGRCTA